MFEPNSPKNEQHVAEPWGNVLRNLAHELRDALSAVVSSLELMRLRQFERATVQTAADSVERGVRRALATIDAFVLAEQCESRAIVLENQRCSLNQILQTAKEGLPGELSERCEFIPAASTIETSADVVRSVQVVTALLHHVSRVAVPGSALEVQGEAEGSQPKIRIRSRVEPSMTATADPFKGYRSVGSGGMALRTAQQIMALQHGGLQIVADVPGRYELVATFAGPTAAEPRQGAQQPDQGRTSAPSRDRTPGFPVEGPQQRAVRHIIIVDDNAEVRRGYREPLQTLGYTVTEAGDAEEALYRIEHEPPEAALIDVHLPCMNGYRLAQALKARLGSRIRLIMFSGMMLDATTERLSREAGFDDCLDKMAGAMAVHRLLQTGANSMDP